MSVLQSLTRTTPFMLAAVGPVAIGGILAVRAGDPSPLVLVPAITFGVVGVTSPALYIATAIAGRAPSLERMGRALVVALGAFGVALAGLILPAAFLAWSSLGAATTIAVTTGAIAVAAYVALRRLAHELAISGALAQLAVFAGWSIATVGIAARLWWNLAVEVVA
jgi:hypothetical protein